MNLVYGNPIIPTRIQERVNAGDLGYPRLAHPKTKPYL